MSNLKSHFTFTKRQRSEIFVLILIIVTLQTIYFFVDFNKEPYEANEEHLAMVMKEIDSLRSVNEANSKPKIYPFNPNFITDYKGYTLGMTTDEIDRLLAYRAQDKWINSAREFQKVTQVSDAFLNEISPFFKFPEWVSNSRPSKRSNFSKTRKPKSFDEKIDLNVASADELQKIYGIGDKLSKRIIAYRTKVGGQFISDIQLGEVYGLSSEVINRIKDHFTVKTPKEVQKINLNTASIEELVEIQYIDYEIANFIVQERTLREGFDSLDELTKVKDFPIDKIEIIKLYLTL